MSASGTSLFRMVPPQSALKFGPVRISREINVVIAHAAIERCVELSLDVD